MKYANQLKKNELKTMVSKESHITFVALACYEMKKIPNICNLISLREMIYDKYVLIYCINLRILERMK